MQRVMPDRHLERKGDLAFRTKRTDRADLGRLVRQLVSSDRAADDLFDARSDSRSQLIDTMVRHDNLHSWTKLDITLHRGNELQEQIADP